MNQKRFDRLVQLAIAIIVLAMLVWLVSTEAITGDIALGFIGVILAAFGFEAGRRTEYQRR